MAATSSLAGGRLNRSSQRKGGDANELPEWRLAVAITLVAGILRLAIAGLTPLFPDETYYWEWSRRLAAGYFDHPPMIAWLIRAGTWLVGDTPVGVRLLPVVAGVTAAFFLSAAARRLSGNRAALLAAIIFAALPLSAAGLVLATPDAPLFAAASATLYAVVRALKNPPRSRGSLRWWLIAGMTLGLALCSKYTAVLVPLGVLIALVSRRELRPRLGESGPYIATLVALLIFSPVVLWNAKHDWISFAFQIQHGLGVAPGSLVKRELDLLGGQIGLVSPILFVMLAIAVVRLLRAPRSPVHPLLSIMAIVIFAFFMYSATRRRVEPNWPALAYVPSILLLVAHPTSRKWDVWLRSGIALAATLTVVTYVNAFVPILPIAARRDPVARSAGWDDLARAVNRIYAPRLPISAYRTHLAADRYQEASQLAFHLPNHPETHALNLRTRPNSYDLWPTFVDRALPRDGLIFVADDSHEMHPTVALLAPHFASVSRGEHVTLARDGDPVRYLRIWVLGGWRGTWPQRQLRFRP